MNNIKISFYVLAYNHSNLIEKAINGALNQRCDPIEIIISDDFSTDDTWEKIQRAAAGYTGPHKIIIRRNEKNLGISEHINKILDICTGDWIFASAGDDWSDPSRVSETMELVAANPTTMLVQTWLNEIDEHGNLLSVNDLGRHKNENVFEKTRIQDRLDNKIFSGHGAAMAYSRQLINVFGGLPNNIIFEDNILSLRAELHGDLVILKKPLVNHTNHDGQITRVQAGVSAKTREKRRVLRLVSDINSTQQNIKDIKKQNEIKPNFYLQSLIKLYGMRLDYFNTKYIALTSRGIVKLMSAVKLVTTANKYAPLSKDDLLRALLPYPAYRLARKVRQVL